MLLSQFVPFGLWFCFFLSFESESCSVVSNSLWPHGLYSPWNSPGQNIGVGRLSLLQGIFPTQGLNPGLPLCRQILYQPSHKGSPRILEWVALPFSSRSAQHRNWTGVSCIAGGFFYQLSYQGATQLTSAQTTHSQRSQHPGPTLGQLLGWQLSVPGLDLGQLFQKRDFRSTSRMAAGQSATSFWCL